MALALPRFFRLIEGCFCCFCWWWRQILSLSPVGEIIGTLSHQMKGHIVTMIATRRPENAATSLLHWEELDERWHVWSTFYLYFQLNWSVMVEQRRGHSENSFRCFNEAQDHKTDWSNLCQGSFARTLPKQDIRSCRTSPINSVRCIFGSRLSRE